MQVFLSYARADATAEADELRNLLGNARQATWVDRHDLPAGENWWEKARQAIATADAFVLLITPVSIKSEQVKKEYEYALTLGKHFLPVLVKKTDVPPELKTRTYRDLTEGRYTSGLTKLIGDLTEVWDTVRRNLVELRIRPAGALDWKPLPGELASLVEKLEGHATAKVRPPEVFERFGEIIGKFRDEAEQRPLFEILDGFLNSNRASNESFGPVIGVNWSFFEDLLGPVRDLLSPEKGGEALPIVLVTMTRSQAEELANGSALNGAPADVAAQWNELKATLRAQWTAHYGDRVEDWKPYGDVPIGKAVRDELSQISTASQRLYAKFFDVGSLNREEWRRQLRDLRYNGCVVVMDIVSIFHPKVHDAYLQSMLCAQQRAMLVQISSFGSFPALGEVTVTFRKRLDLEFWARLKMDKDRNCRRFLDEVDFSRFLSNELTEVLPAEKRPAAGGVLPFIQRR
jgi:TIR domain-containing protein